MKASIGMTKAAVLPEPGGSVSQEARQTKGGKKLPDLFLQYQ